MISLRLASLVILCGPLLAAATPPLAPVPDAVSPGQPGAVRLLEPDRVHLDGWLGHRINVNVAHRLTVVDTVPLLAGYMQRPGTHPWIGEHIGKWLHAATLAWVYSGDEQLKGKLDAAAAELMATQEPDGYLGTYEPTKRFGLYEGADWDVWSHKYNLIGLLTYYRYTGNPAALAACRRMGDLLIRTFPATRSINGAGTHLGLAATSVLEPIVDLYRATGDTRYLEFARYIVSAYEERGATDLVRALLAPGAHVDAIGNGKAYEMLSNLVGIGQLCQVTGDPQLRRALEAAWNDITRNRLYLTGAASVRELFSLDHELPNSVQAHPGETCVTTTWIQFNAGLLALTGEAKYADEIERALYNHLTAAQHPDGADWCYYTALEGTKHYDKEITCCHSSGPRGLALAPTLAYLQSSDTLWVSTLESSKATFDVNGQSVQIEQHSGFPRAGHSVLSIRTKTPVRFALRIRVPAWAAPMKAGEASGGAGWLTIPAREWHDGDQVPVEFQLGGRIIRGEYTNQSHIAYGWGPFILALDLRDNPPFRVYDAPQFIRVFDEQAPVLAADNDGLKFRAQVRGEWDIDAHPVTLVPFADAGREGSLYAVWLRAPR